MQATPWTRGCATVAVVLGVIGLYLDSLAAVAGVMGIVALLCGQAALFLYRTVRYAGDLHVERMIGEGPVYVGTPVEVTVRATMSNVPGLQVRLTDLPPQSAAYEPVEAIVNRGEGRYQVHFMAPGEVSFRGVLIETADRFFSTTLLCAGPRYTGEKITVRPITKLVSEPGLRGSAGVRELARMGTPRGEGISGFRPFRQGDEPAMMDWKLTAKYGRPFVRESTTQVGSAPLVVVDLPASQSPESSAILSAAGETIERVVREHGQCTLLLIRGGEVIDYRDHEPNLMSLFRLLSLQLPGSIHPLYRVKDPVVLQAKLRLAEQGTLISSQRFATALRATIKGGMRSSFENTIDHVMAMGGHREVVVYTTSSDEVSHLNLLSAAARRRKRHLVIRLPRSVSGSIPWLSPYPRVERI